jgi:hypothetical protein
MGQKEIKFLTPGSILFIVGLTFQVFNAAHWGWWTIDLERNPLAPGAIYDGYTIQQLIAMHFGWLAGPLILITLIMSVLGLIMILREGSEKSLRKWLREN